jgi:hypothetical protein
MRNNFFIIFISIFFSSLIYAFNRANEIPGIDPLPIAIQSGGEISSGKDTDKSQKDSTLKEDLEKSTTEYPDFPRIRNLKVVQDSTYPYSAKITWDLHPQVSTPIYVVRYTRPISTKDILLNSYNLTSPPLSPNTTTFIDIDIPEGVYYYAAVTSFELSREGILVLKPGVNYTVTPFIVYRNSNIQSTNLIPEKLDLDSKDRTKLTPQDFEISELMALNTEKGVVLNWKPVNISDIKYKIYRSNEPLDSLERIQKAKLLGESIKPYYLDTEPIYEEAVYYGVSVFDIQSNKEYADLKFRKSYITHTFKKPKIEYQYLQYLPDSLIAYQINKDTIQLFWVDAGPSVKFYKVYRYDAPIFSENILSKAQYLGNIQSGSIGFVDSNLKSGRYFYAVFPVISNNQELKIFSANRTFTTFGIIIRGEDKDIYKEQEKKVPQTKTESIRTNIKNILIRLENNRDVRITWDYISENANKIKVLIYRSTIQILKYEDLKENSTYLGEFPLVAGVFLDRNLSDGNYYYNFIEYNTETNEITAFYYLKKPIEIKQDKTIPEENQTVKNDAKKTQEESITQITQKEPKKEEEKQETQTKQDLEALDQLNKKKQNNDKIIDDIINQIYIKKDFINAEKRIKSLLKKKELDKEQLGKIKFHYGFLLFKLNRYNEAKKYFLDDDVQNYDKERADFWFKRVIEKE